MSGCGNPAYGLGRILTEAELKLMSDDDILYSYTAINCKFKFPENVKYPSIPCYLDETATVYPLSGEAVLTGAEYLLAKSQGCEITIKNIYYIPFEYK
jgi:hypothetical protein